MFWTEPDEEEEALLCSPALMARRASESWIVAPPVEVRESTFRQPAHLRSHLLSPGNLKFIATDFLIEKSNGKYGQKKDIYRSIAERIFQKLKRSSCQTSVLTDDMLDRSTAANPLSLQKFQLLRTRLESRRMIRNLCPW